MNMYAEFYNTIAANLFTFVPVWVVQDVLVLIAALLVCVYIIRREERPVPILLEMAAFVFLNAAVYENFATLMGWYAYGRSVLMVFNVPLTVPVIEYLVVYTALKMLSKMQIQAWCKPFVVGFTGMVFDFALDPVAVLQVFRTKEALIGRWTWYPGPGDVVIYGEPVYNFTGWVLLCGYAAAMLLLGRWWYKKSGYHPAVGILYPLLTMIGALGVMISPLSKFLLWLEPLYARGSVAEWIMLAVFIALPVLMLLVFWRGRMLEGMSFRKDYPVFLVLIGFPVINIIFCLIGGYFGVLWLVSLAAAVLALMVMSVYLFGRRVRVFERA